MGEKGGGSGSKTAPMKAEVLCVQGPVSTQDGVWWGKGGEIGCVGSLRTWNWILSYLFEEAADVLIVVAA